MNIFSVILTVALLSILWGPSLVAAHLFKLHSGKVRFLSVLLPLQAIAAVLLAYAADNAGLGNPAGYVLGIIVAVSIAGVFAVAIRHRTANHALKPTAPPSAGPRLS